MRLTPAEARVKAAGTAREAGLSGEQRRRLGVVHTPPSLARFVAGAVDRLLREELSLGAGLSDERVCVIDPACGPGAFLAAALAVTEARGVTSPDAHHRLIGFDLDAAALEDAQRALSHELAPGASLELHAADALAPGVIKAWSSRAPVAVVIGNPPWVGSAQARPSPELDQLLADFRRGSDGEPLRERKIGVLSDAYVRFIRVAAEIVRRAEQGGVLGLVTNSSYLDGPVHRGMRAALLSWFRRVAVIDLGGNAMIARRGERDDNLFGVRPGAAILLAAHVPERARSRFFARTLRGSAEQKLQTLAEIGEVGLPEGPVPGAPYFLFTGRQGAASADYQSWPSLAEAMPFHREGVQTNRDAFVIDRDRGRLVARLRAFADGQRSDELAPAWARLPHYDPELARQRVRRALDEDPTGEHGRSIAAIAYRPFDVRWFVTIAPLCHRPRPALLRAMALSELALVSVRKDRGREPWAHAAVARQVIDNCFLSARSSCRARAFPTHGPDGAPNLDSAVAERFSERAEAEVSSLDFAHYCLAILTDAAYRAQHVDELRLDYPRIPWPESRERFDACRRLGRRLAEAFDSVGGAHRLTVGHHRVLGPRLLAEHIG